MTRISCLYARSSARSKIRTRTALPPVQKSTKQTPPNERSKSRALSFAGNRPPTNSPAIVPDNSMHQDEIASFSLVLFAFLHRFLLQSCNWITRTGPRSPLGSCCANADKKSGCSFTNVFVTSITNLFLPLLIRPLISTR
jgi:hypothetical protein